MVKGPVFGCLISCAQNLCLFILLQGALSSLTWVSELPFEVYYLLSMKTPIDNVKDEVHMVHIKQFLYRK